MVKIAVAGAGTEGNGGSGAVIVGCHLIVSGSSGLMYTVFVWFCFGG